MNRTLGKRLEKTPYPTLDQMETEIARRKYRKRFSSALRGTVYSLAVVAAIAVLVATLWMPVLRITGTSMEPTVRGGHQNHTAEPRRAVRILFQQQAFGQAGHRLRR